MYEKYVKDIMNLYDKEQDEYDALAEKELPHEKADEEEEKIREKYDKLLIENNKKYNVVFRYDLKDTWSTQMATLIITSDKENNVICVYDNEGKKKELENASFTIDSSKVVNVLSKYEDKFKNMRDPWEIPGAPVLDGFKNDFYFDINGKTYSFSFDNLGVWYEQIPEEVKIFLDLFDEVRNVLLNDVKNLDRCLTLGY